MKFLRVLALPIALLVVLVVRLLKNRVVIRFGEFWVGRLGHLVGNTECYLSERDAGLHAGAFDIWFPVGKSANRVVSRKYAKHLHLWPAWFARMVVAANRMWARAKLHEVMPAQYDRDIYNLCQIPHIGFTAKEEKDGQALLRALDMPARAKWVCLIVRDAEYLKARGAFSYHDYRDSDVNDYALAAVALADRGYYVLRMGAAVAKPFDAKHPRIIDYALSGKRSEFGDLYLGARCAFCLGTSCGFMAIPAAFKRPCAVVNFAPLEYLPTSYDKSLAIWKHHVREGKRMSVAEIVASGAGQFMAAQQFAEAGITLEDNTPAEIRDLALQAHWEQSNRIGIFEQTEFWAKFPKSVSPYNSKPLHGRIVLRIGRAFLKGYDENLRSDGIAGGLRLVGMADQDAA